jgi:hypothetical protein
MDRTEQDGLDTPRVLDTTRIRTPKEAWSPWTGIWRPWQPERGRVARAAGGWGQQWAWPLSPKPQLMLLGDFLEMN